MFREQLEGQVHHLDFSVKEDRQYFLESVGGEEHLKEFPTLYNAFQQSCLADYGRRQEKNDKTDNIDIDFYDLTFVSTDQKNGKHAESGDKQPLYHVNVHYRSFIVDSKTVLQDPTPAQTMNVCTRVRVFDPKSARGGFLEQHDYFPDVNHIDVECSGEEIYGREELENRNLQQEVLMTYVDEKGEMQSYTYNKKVKAKNEADLPFSNIVFEDPVSKNATEQIRLLYGRDSTHLDHPDYRYPNNNTSQGFLRTIVPIKGQITFKKPEDGGSYGFDGLRKVQEGEKMTRPVLEVDGKDWKTFRKDLNDEEFYNKYNDKNYFSFEEDKDGNQILKFDFYHCDFPEKDDDRHYDWNTNMKGHELDGRDRICFLVGSFRCNINRKDKEGKVVAFSDYQINCISAEKNKLPKGREYYKFKEGSATIYIPVIRMWWGCYARNTKIKMENGTYKMADQLVIGDKVRGYGDEILIVDNIYTGYEHEIISIHTDFGHQLHVTKGHPILKEDQETVRAADILTGDYILNENKYSEQVIATEKIAYNDIVYNFSFRGHENGAFLIADGLYAGDFYAQNNNQAKKTEPSEQQKQIALEMQQLVGQLNAKKNR